MKYIFILLMSSFVYAEDQHLAAMGALPSIPEHLRNNKEFIRFFHSVIPRNEQLPANPVQQLFIRDWMSTGISPEELYEKIQRIQKRTNDQLLRAYNIRYALDSQSLPTLVREIRIGAKAGFLFGFGVDLSLGYAHNGKRFFPTLGCSINWIPPRFAGEHSSDFLDRFCIGILPLIIAKEDSLQVNGFKWLSIKTSNSTDTAVFGGKSIRYQETESRSSPTLYKELNMGLWKINAEQDRLKVLVPLFIPLPGETTFLLKEISSLETLMIQALQHFNFRKTDVLMQEIQLKVTHLEKNLQKNLITQLTATNKISSSEGHPLNSPSDLFHPSALIEFSPDLIPEDCQAALKNKSRAA